MRSNVADQWACRGEEQKQQSRCMYMYTECKCARQRTSGLFRLTRTIEEEPKCRTAWSVWWSSLRSLPILSNCVRARNEQDIWLDVEWRIHRSLFLLPRHQTPRRSDEVYVAWFLKRQQTGAGSRDTLRCVFSVGRCCCSSLSLAFLLLLLLQMHVLPTFSFFFLVLPCYFSWKMKKKQKEKRKKGSRPPVETNGTHKDQAGDSLADARWSADPSLLQQQSDPHDNSPCFIKVSTIDYS